MITIRAKPEHLLKPNVLYYKQYFFTHTRVSHPLFRPFNILSLMCLVMDLVSLTHKTKNPSNISALGFLKFWILLFT